MSIQLSEVLLGGQRHRSPRIWLKASQFCTHLFLGESGDPWVGAAEYLAYFSQSHQLLSPDVAVIEVGDLYDSWVARHPALQVEMGSKRRASFPLRKLLEQGEPRALLAEVLTAVGAHVRGQVPIVLAMPAPRCWVRHACRLACREETQFESDSVEEGAMYIADMLRSVSTAPVSGVLLEESSDSEGEEEGDAELYRPITNLVKHYHWSPALRAAKDRTAKLSGLAEFDVLIAPGTRADGRIAIGLDISEPLLAGQQVPTVDDGELYFAEIPKDIRPESLLEALATLRACV